MNNVDAIPPLSAPIRRIPRCTTKTFWELRFCLSGAFILLNDGYDS